MKVQMPQQENLVLTPTLKHLKEVCTAARAGVPIAELVYAHAVAPSHIREYASLRAAGHPYEESLRMLLVEPQDLIPTRICIEHGLDTEGLYSLKELSELTDTPLSDYAAAITAGAPVTELLYIHSRNISLSKYTAALYAGASPEELSIVMSLPLPIENYVYARSCGVPHDEVLEVFLQKKNIMLHARTHMLTPLRNTRLRPSSAQQG